MTSRKAARTGTHESIVDLAGRTLAWNPAPARMYGWTEAEALLMNIQDRIPPGLREEALARLRQPGQAEVLEPYRTRRLTKTGAQVDIWLTATALLSDAGRICAIATTEQINESGSDGIPETPDGQPR